MPGRTGRSTCLQRLMRSPSCHPAPRQASTSGTEWPTSYNSDVAKGKAGARAHLNDRTLLDHIRALPHARATYKQLVKELGLTGESRDQLEQALDRLADKGLLVELRSGHFIATGANAEYLVGRLSIHRDGFGFLVPDVAAGEPSGGDIFLPPNEAAKGMNGDRALVHVTRQTGLGRGEGTILRILRRAHTTVVGEFRIRKRGNFVVPSDERVQQWIEIPEGCEIPPKRASQHRVGVTLREIATAGRSRRHDRQLSKSWSFPKTASRRCRASCRSAGLCR